MDGAAEILWRKRVDSETLSNRIESLVAQEADRQVATWIRVCLGCERKSTVVAQYGYRDRSGFHPVIS